MASTWLPIAGNVPVYAWKHRYFAATKSTTNGDPGIQLDHYQVDYYTDDASHTKLSNEVSRLPIHKDPS